MSELYAIDNAYQGVVAETQQLLTNIAPSCNFDAAEINEWNEYVGGDSDDETEDENEEVIVEGDEQSTSVPYSEAIKSVNQLMKWCEANDEGVSHISNLLNLRKNIITKHLTVPQIQQQVTDYFKPL